MEAFTIADVAALCGIQEITTRNGKTYCVCPFCGDKRKKFDYIVELGKKKNMYNCFNCGEHGSGVELYMKLSGNSYSGEDGYKQAMKDIGSALKGLPSKPVKKTYECPPETKKAAPEVCSAVYYELLKLLKLNEEHKKDLLRRGLTEKDIKRFRFRSTPEDKNILKKLFSICKGKGLSLKGVPGFYQDDRNFWRLKIPAKGYFCPVYDGNLIIGFQIRVDNPLNGAKYMWLSSSGKKNGVSAGAPATILKGAQPDMTIVTEGILKALVVYSLLKGQVTVIGIGGVKILSVLKTVFENSTEVIFEAFDADKHYKEAEHDLFDEALCISLVDNIPFEEVLKRDKFHSIQKAFLIQRDAEKLCKMAEDYGHVTHPLNWDVTKDNFFWKGEFKGLDDFLLNYKDKDKFVRYLISVRNKCNELQKFLQE